MASLSWPLPATPADSTFEPHFNAHNFVNALPQPNDPLHIPITRSSVYDATYPALRPRRSDVKPLIWPAIAISVPLALLSAALLGLVFGYAVRPQRSIFQGSEAPYTYSQPYVLVDFSATRLVFAASFLSTVAPLLTSYVMTVWARMAATTMSRASGSSRFEKLPTPYQLSVLVGLCLASFDQLRTYVMYFCSRKRRIGIPPVLNKAALMFTLAVLLATGVFVADTALHYLTSTILFDRVRIHSEPTQSYGYGLSKTCLDLDRIKDNSAFPCSLAVGPTFLDPNETAEANEISRLQANTSTVSQIQLTGVDGMEGDVAVLIPHPRTVAANYDYRTTSIGVGTVCNLVPPRLCDMRGTGNYSSFTDFNCSENFYGQLGKSPNISSTDGMKAHDPDLSPLAFKPGSNLQYAYFTSPNLDVIWNPESWNSSTNQPNDPPYSHPVPDDDLLNPFFVGFGARLSNQTFAEGSSMPHADLVLTNDNYVVDFIMSCSVTSYDVTFTWYKSSIQNVSITPSPNGTLLEVFHGRQSYFTVSGGAFDLQQNLVLAAIGGNDTTSFLNKWQDLFSVKVLGTIGGYTTGRKNLEEQSRESLLVAKVPKSALGALIGLSLLYSVLGVALFIAVMKASSEDVHSISEQLSLAGLTNMAFGESKEKEPVSAMTPQTPQASSPNEGDYLSTKTSSRSETRRVRIHGADFQVWV